MIYLPSQITNLTKISLRFDSILPWLSLTFERRAGSTLTTTSHIYQALQPYRPVKKTWLQNQQTLLICWADCCFTQQLIAEVRISIAFLAAAPFFFYRIRRPENRGTFCVISRY
jgi:hypothetical protein